MNILKSKRKPNIGPANLGLRSGQAGKGDADRSPGWRKHYDAIQWPHFIVGSKRIGSKLVKVYSLLLLLCFSLHADTYLTANLDTANRCIEIAWQADEYAEQWEVEVCYSRTNTQPRSWIGWTTGYTDYLQPYYAKGYYYFRVRPAGYLEWSNVVKIRVNN